MLEAKTEGQLRRNHYHNFNSLKCIYFILNDGNCFDNSACDYPFNNLLKSSFHANLKEYLKAKFKKKKKLWFPSRFF